MFVRTKEEAAVVVREIKTDQISGRGDTCEQCEGEEQEKQPAGTLVYSWVSLCSSLVPNTVQKSPSW